MDSVLAALLRHRMTNVLMQVSFCGRHSRSTESIEINSPGHLKKLTAFQ
jgi:hypothetical protein